MAELWIVGLRTLLTYGVVFLIIRFMGKREIGKLSVFDLVISFMIAEIAVIVIESTSKPILHAIVPMVILMLIQIVISYLALKFRGLRTWFDGKPTILIAKGKLDREAMRKQRYNLDDLMLQLRENKIASVSDVEFAILETSGKLSIIERGPAQENAPEAPGDEADPKQPPIHFPKNYKYEELPIPLIMDGKVMDDNLKKIGKTRFWLRKELQDRNIGETKEVFLCTVDYKGAVYVTLRESGSKPDKAARSEQQGFPAKAAGAERKSPDERPGSKTAKAAKAPDGTPDEAGGSGAKENGTDKAGTIGTTDKTDKTDTTQKP